MTVAAAASGELRRALHRDGFAVLHGVLDDAQSDALLDLVGAVETGGRHRRAGVRRLLERAPELADWLDRPPLRPLVEAALSPRARPVRGILFDKSPDANWLVPWHQDLAIAVAERRDGLPGYGPWSVKEGVVHVQPPVAVLERMVTLRVHLDHCDASDGALRVLPGSHRSGVAPDRPSGTPVTCAAARGAVLLMRPLLWHASAKATTPTHRRVLHVEFADADLPRGLRWRAA